MVFIKKYKLIFLLVLLVILICGLLSAIYYLGSFNNSRQNSQSTIGNDLKNYAAFKQKFNSFSSPILPYTRAVGQIKILEDKSASKKSRYDALTQAFSFLTQLYSQTHNQKLYVFLNKDFNSFAKENFPEYYKASYFSYSCQDPVCQDTPQPPEIAQIIEEIKSTTGIPENIKTTLYTNLITDSYISKNDPLRIGSYIISAEIIRTDDSFIKAGVGNKFADKIEAYLKSAYPKEYSKFLPNIIQQTK